MKNLTFISAYPKSGITYLNFMLFNILFDKWYDRKNIDQKYIVDIHENVNYVPDDGVSAYVKTHFSFNNRLPLGTRGKRAVCLVRNPIDAMMSAWDFKHLTGDDALLRADEAARDQALRRHIGSWISTGGDGFPFAGTWVENVTSWLDQIAMPALFVRYEVLKADPHQQLTRILDFLDIEIDNQRLDQAIEAGKPDNMRREEAEEIATGTTGVFYRHHLSKGYSHGHRFVGKLHQNVFDAVLTEAERRQAIATFGPTLERIEERSK